MLKMISTALLAISLTGCVSNIIEPSEPKDTSYYVVDLKDYSFCLGNTGACHNLSTITNGTLYAAPIEEAYGQKISYPNYRGSLLKMMLRPADQSYTPEKISDNGRYYKLPINDKTDTVWKVMERIHAAYYDDKEF
ncbi:MAG: hypothetical protein OIF55_11610 [Amphritea sp.]|nr:hypothetical protein [Amphritea sp.]